MTTPQPLSSDQAEQFHRDGYLIVSGLLNEQETLLLQETARADDRMRQAAMDVKDTQGRRTGLSLWNHPGNDIYGCISRCERIVYGMQQLLEDEVYHYHSKLSAKEPHVGGAWEWHQDYGYWYSNGCLFPDMASIFIAVDPCTRENGCMQVLKGSHHLGRIEHGRFGQQTGADPERVAEAAKIMETVYCVMEPGDGLYFHSNLLHASDPNTSELPRWGLLCCYNTKHNNPYVESHHPNYTPLDVLPDRCIVEMGARGSADTQTFLVQGDDETTG